MRWSIRVKRELQLLPDEKVLHAQYRPIDASNCITESVETNTTRLFEHNKEQQDNSYCIHWSAQWQLAKFASIATHQTVAKHIKPLSFLHDQQQLFSLQFSVLLFPNRQNTAPLISMAAMLRKTYAEKLCVGIILLN